MSVRIAVEAMKIGAIHYLTMPFSGEELCLLIDAALPRDPDHACLWDERHQASPSPQRPAMSMLFVGRELAPLVTLKLMIERHMTAEVALNAPIALRWLSTHFLTLLVVHDSLPIADGIRLVRIAQSMAPACPVLLISGGAPNSQLAPELASLPVYRLTADPGSFDRLLRELIEVLAVRHALMGPPPRFSPYVVKALSYVSTHYAEALQVNTVAGAIGVSAEKVGFSDASHLSWVFRRYVGYRPGTFRRDTFGT